MYDVHFVAPKSDWERIERKLAGIEAHGKVINSLHLIVRFAIDNPELQLDVIRQRLSISRAAMKKYAELLGIAGVEDDVAVTSEEDGTLVEELTPLVVADGPIPMTQLAQRYGVSTSYVFDRLREIKSRLDAEEKSRLKA